MTSRYGSASLLTVLLALTSACGSPELIVDSGTAGDTRVSTDAGGGGDVATTDIPMVPLDVNASDTPVVDAPASDAPVVDASGMDVAMTSDVGGADVASDRGSPLPDAIIGRDVPTAGGCAVQSDCAGGYACSIDACGTRGTCVVIGRCSLIFAPECGCDGMTYTNTCIRTNASVGLAHVGACTDAGTATDSGTALMCRVPVGCCATDADCGGRGQFCVNVGTSCSTPRGTTTGVCKTRPTIATQCWRDADCLRGTCTGPRICPCQARCLLPDAAGTCG